MIFSFCVEGNEGAVAFDLQVLWNERWNNTFPKDTALHSRSPIYEGHEPEKRHCEVLNGVCYSDTISNREEMYETLANEGEEALFEKLEDVYRQYIGE